MGLLSIFVQFNKKLGDRLSVFDFFKDDDFTEFLVNKIYRIIDTKKPKLILEIGGADRPLIEKNSCSYQFYGLDIDKPSCCEMFYDEFMDQPVEKTISCNFDLIVSKSLLEHTEDNKQVLDNLYSCLKPKGMMVHYIPSKYHPYSTILRIVGPKLQLKIIKSLRPWALPLSGYRAYFSYCSPGQMKRLLKDVGFVNIEITTFYGAKDYFKFFLPLFVLIALYDNIMRVLPYDFGASGFLLYCEKPGV